MTDQLRRHVDQPVRIERMRALLDHLEGPRPLLTPAEHLRSARLVPGWSVVRGPHTRWTLDAPGRADQHLSRDELIAVLSEEWAPAARTELLEPVVTDGITEARRADAVGLDVKRGDWFFDRSRNLLALVLIDHNTAAPPAAHCMLGFTATGGLFPRDEPLGGRFTLVTLPMHTLMESAVLELAAELAR